MKKARPVSRVARAVPGAARKVVSGPSVAVAVPAEARLRHPVQPPARARSGSHLRRHRVLLKSNVRNRGENSASRQNALPRQLLPSRGQPLRNELRTRHLRGLSAQTLRSVSVPPAPMHRSANSVPQSASALRLPMPRRGLRRPLLLNRPRRLPRQSLERHRPRLAPAMRNVPIKVSRGPLRHLPPPSRSGAHRQ
ncbi:hypothetical protein SAMN02927923_02579 [Microvirga guangxiensis]|uniref:Uncharacterized protein n=1 Tax=Microvirga guangxiensis TaxID=549386 RepID=A0A1G5JA02_9HYPH|nr:hypothetical protein SAMN02927923_02579 [Microvirga guangxiensis]